MKTGRKPTTGARVLDLLRTFGPLTAREMAESLGRRPQDISGAIAVMRRAEVRGEPRLVHVHDWRLPATRSSRESAIWAFGDAPDKPNPRGGRADTRGRFDEMLEEAERDTQMEVGGNPFATAMLQVMR